MKFYRLVGDEPVNLDLPNARVHEVTHDFEAETDEKAKEYAVRLARHMHYWELFVRIHANPHHHHDVV